MPTTRSLISDKARCFSQSERALYGNLIISNGNRTEWSPIRSAIIQVIAKSDDREAITSMITDRIGRHEVLLPINHNNYNFREKKNSQVIKIPL